MNITPPLHAIHLIGDWDEQTTEQVLNGGFNVQQCTDLIALRQSYQQGINGRSDRAPVLRSWTFLRLVVQSGRITL